MKYHYIVSLGHGCQPAHHAIRAGLHKVSLPMDWIGDANLHVADRPIDTVMSKDEPTACVKLIENDFVGLWDAENLEVEIIPSWECNPQKVTDTKYGISCVHEFKVDHVYDNIERVQMMYARRVRRFQSIVQSDGPVLFIRTLFTERNARLMSEMLRRKYSDLQFTLLVVNRMHEQLEDWDIPNVIKLNLEFAPDWAATDPRYDKLWDDIFAGFELDLKEIEL